MPTFGNALSMSLQIMNGRTASGVVNLISRSLHIVQNEKNHPKPSEMGPRLRHKNG